MVLTLCNIYFWDLKACLMSGSLILCLVAYLMWDVFAYAMKVCCCHRMYKQVNEICSVIRSKLLVLKCLCNHCDVYCTFIRWTLRQANIATKLQFRSNRIPKKREKVADVTLRDLLLTSNFK
ncbi:hypothetical protein EDB19DRAFT_1737397 [Suillus lakei]|nr:hypothetical protein EDB19DRAFT_1737397 [Suillus lakei]